MATNFPSGLDSFTNPSATDSMDSVSVPHASQHANLNDAVEALEAKVGVNGSAVTSSLDYKVAQQGLTLVKSQTAGTAVSSVTLNNVFSSTFDNYLVTVTNGTFNTANTQVQGLLVAGGSASSTGYKNRLLYSSYSAGTPLAANTTSNQNILWWGGTKANATAPVFCRLWLMGPYLTDGTYMTSDAYGTDGFAGNSSCYHSLTVSYDGLRVFPETGTMTGCVIRVYGYNNG